MARTFIILIGALVGLAFVVGLPPVSQAQNQTFEYAGSKSCQVCHAEIFSAWQKSPHAKMTRSMADVPDVKDLPADQFELPKENIRWVLGSHYVHRFVAEASGTLVVLPRIFDRHEKKWLTIKDYGWHKRYWLKQCAGCHTTGFQAGSDTFIEPGVGCESCHGPALNHVRTGAKEFVVNPAKLDPDRREMVCESCHTSGVDNTGEYCFPIGYRPGEDLTKYFAGLTPKPGQDSTTFLGDETYADRRRQWDFLKSRLFLAKGLTCDYCQNFRNYKTNPGSDYLTHDQYCLTCHTDRENHPAASPGSTVIPGTNCTSCHAPMVTKSGEAFSIHDHKFCFECPRKAPKP